MKYNVLEKNNAKTVTDIISDQNKKLTNLINNTDLFWRGFYENMPKGKIHVKFRGHVPFYIDSEYYLFQRVEIQQYERLNMDGSEKITKKSADLLKRLLKDIKINRIHDEDGCNGFFSKDRSNPTLKDEVAYCYINPDIPDGYWENHLLETSYIEL